MEPLAQGLPRLPQPKERVSLSLHHRPNSFSVPISATNFCDLPWATSDHSKSGRR